MKFASRFCLLALLLTGGALYAQDHAQDPAGVSFEGSADLEAFRAQVAAGHPELDVVSVTDHD